MDVDVLLLKIAISQFPVCLFFEARASLQTIERSSESNSGNNDPLGGCRCGNDSTKKRSCSFACILAFFGS